jgi:hypothetical protein
MPKKTTNPLVSRIPEKPIRYGPFMRLGDRWAGRRDGKAGLPDVKFCRDGHGGAPYLSALNHRYATQAELAKLLSDAAIASAVARRITVEQEILAADDRLIEARKELDAKPEMAPPDFLAQATGLERELNKPEEDIRKRNQNIWDGARATLVTADLDAAKGVRSLRTEYAQLTGTITAREQIRDTRARRLLDQTLRRSRTYQRQLVLRHPDGAELLPLLHNTEPTLPAWVQESTRHPNAHPDTR